MKTSEIRQSFLDYFQKNGHAIVDSSSLVPDNDPTLLFTNAGMVQFKDYFLGLESRDYTRATSSQRCVRAGGKHNDLENVGYTARHHTFFEMLGNFSFGDYFKREAIQFCWSYLTEVLKLPKDKLWITVFEDDKEAEKIWLDEIGVPADRMSRCGAEDNFWSMGDTGPCGPCTEVFYDHGPEIAGGPPGSPEQDGDRYTEIWNLVFMQYNRDKSGTLNPLPKPSVDTGMGLERIAAVLQGVHTNYDTDLFQHLRSAIIKQIKLKEYSDASVNVIADHIRSCCFLIIDGVIPANEGRGYVLRRIIRRAIRHGSKLELANPFFYKSVQSLVETMGEAYPELKSRQRFLENILKQEEEQFCKTLKNGMRLLEEEIDKLAGKELAGDVAFKLYDTYGFPADLTNDVLRERGLSFDEKGFEKAMGEQRKRSKAGSQFGGAYLSDIKEASEFVGYDSLKADAKVTALFDDESRLDEFAELGGEVKVILDKTTFYPEGGGQVGDRGLIEGEDLKIEIYDTRRQGQAIIHLGRLQYGTLKSGVKITATVKTDSRVATMLNHSATHLMHAALREILGTHVEQKGSLVDADRTRFDFSHTQAVTREELRRIEDRVNEKIRENLEVKVENLSIDDAKERGAMMLFGEKYGDSVRVLTMGDFSCELCGGTHVNATGEIGYFKFVSEEAVASGIRRIEAITGPGAQAYISSMEDSLALVGDVVKTPLKKLDMIPERVVALSQSNRELEREKKKLEEKLAQYASLAILGEAEAVNGVNILIYKSAELKPKGMRDLLDKLKDKLRPAIIVLIADLDDKINVVAGITKGLEAKTIAPKDMVAALCGKGGGRPDMAQGGGAKPADLDARLAKLKLDLSQDL